VASGYAAGLVFLKSWVQTLTATCSHEYSFRRSLDIGARANDLNDLGRRRTALLSKTEHYGETRSNEVNLLCLKPFFVSTLSYGFHHRVVSFYASIIFSTAN
jgi:hypothetical protein